MRVVKPGVIQCATPAPVDSVDNDCKIEPFTSESDIDNLASIPNAASGLGLQKDRRLEVMENHKRNSRLSMKKVIGNKKDISKRASLQKGPQLCTVCGKMCWRLKTHMRRHVHRDYVCLDCGRKFTRSDYLQDHKSVHSGERRFLCVKCGASFKAAKNLRNHMRTHLVQRRYQCEQCGKWFRRSSGRNEHVRMVHEGMRRILAHGCSRCDRAFATAKQLKWHVMDHTNERPFGCPICSKRFKRKNYLERHMEIHTGEHHRFPCAFCGKQFTQRSSARMHEKTQHAADGGRCFECELCGQKYNKRAIRDAHVRRHKGDKPYHCSLCHWRFVSVGDLRGHMVKKHKVKRNTVSGRPLVALALDSPALEVEIEQDS